jgi:hypothetical protein
VAYTLPAVAVDPSIMPIAIGGSSKPLIPLAMGGAWFIGHRTLLAALEMYCAGIRHFDTGRRLWGGRIGEAFRPVPGRSTRRAVHRFQIGSARASAVLVDVEGSLRGLQTDYVLGIRQERLAIGNGTVDARLTRRRTSTSRSARSKSFGRPSVARRSPSVRESTRCGPAEGDMIPLGFASSSASLFDAATGARI